MTSADDIAKMKRKEINPMRILDSLTYNPFLSKLAAARMTFIKKVRPDFLQYEIEV